LKYYIYVCRCKCSALNLEILILKRHEWYICSQYKRNMLKENGWIWRRNWVINI
jgi:hypothetical protein